MELHKGARRRAEGVVGRIVAVREGLAAQASKAARREGRHATKSRLERDERKHCFTVFDTVPVVAAVRWDVAGASAVVEGAEGRHAAPTRAKDLRDT